MMLNISRRCNIQNFHLVQSIIPSTRVRLVNYPHLSFASKTKRQPKKRTQYQGAGSVAGAECKSNYNCVYENVYFRTMDNAQKELGRASKVAE